MGSGRVVRIITDSAADFEPQEIEKFGIDCIPLKVIFGNEEFRENVDLTKNQFYSLLEKYGFPRTSQPSPYDFQAALGKAKEAGEESVVITLSSALSGTYQGALLAKEMGGYRECYVIDSLNAAGGQRILVERAVKLRDEGKSAAEISEELNALRRRIRLYACMDTLEYLYMGGRISHAVYTIGSLVNIKPILTVSEEGRAVISARALSVSGGIKCICEKISKDTPDTNYPINVMFTKNPANGERLAERIERCGYKINNDRIINAGAVIGTHIGPHAFGAAYVVK